MIYRALTADDKHAYFEMTTRLYHELYGSIHMTADQTQVYSAVAGFDLASDTYAAFDEAGLMLGCAEMWAISNPPSNPHAHVYVIPEKREQGIAERLIAWLLRRAESLRARVPATMAITLIIRNAISAFDPILAAKGFTNAHQLKRMRIDFDGQPPLAQFPTGFRVVTMTEQPHLVDYIRTYREAFMDLRGFTPDTLENRVARWQNDIDVHQAYFDPEYYMLLKDGDTIAGVLMAWTSSREDPDEAWISVVGMLRPYRRRGLASQLLYHAFNLFYDRGSVAAALTVDGSSLTGADKLYEKVGMQAVVIFKEYEKIIRFGMTSHDNEQT